MWCRGPRAGIDVSPGREQGDRLRVPLYAGSDPDGPRIGKSRAVRRALGRGGALERARPHGRRHGPAAFSGPVLLHHEQQRQDCAHTRRQDAHRSQDILDRDPAQ